MNTSERLTKRVGDGIRYDNGEYIVTCYHKNNNLTPVDKLAAKLCDLEDMIENGTMIEPPCKVGDMLYMPYYGRILEYKVTSFSFRVEGLLAHTQSKQTGGLHPVWCASIGKTYFLHRHEAEAVLGRMWQT